MKEIYELMIKNPITINENATVQDAIDMFSTHRVGCLPVIDASERLVGFLSDGDVMEFLARRTKLQDRVPIMYHAASYDEKSAEKDEELIKEVGQMSIMHCATKRVQFCYEDDNTAELATLMDNRRLKFVPVVERDTNKLVGLLSRRDITLAFFDSINKH